MTNSVKKTPWLTPKPHWLDFKNVTFWFSLSGYTRGSVLTKTWPLVNGLGTTHPTSLGHSSVWQEFQLFTNKYSKDIIKVLARPREFLHGSLWKQMYDQPGIRVGGKIKFQKLSVWQNRTEAHQKDQPRVMILCGELDIVSVPEIFASCDSLFFALLWKSALRFRGD